jgi:hypothetical protein
MGEGGRAAGFGLKPGLIFCGRDRFFMAMFT